MTFYSVVPAACFAEFRHMLRPLEVKNDTLVMSGMSHNRPNLVPHRLHVLQHALVIRKT